jgi:DNA-binding MarR family transcriptional regulator
MSEVPAESAELTTSAELTASITFPGLLGAALRAYSAAMVAELDRAGLDDMPRTGYRVIGSLARGSSNLQDIAIGLGMSKQAAGQLVDVLVARDYCLRQSDPQDRRRVLLRLSERGQAAAKAIRDAIHSVNQSLAGQVSRQDVATARAVLTALADFGRSAGDQEASGRVIDEESMS